MKFLVLHGPNLNLFGRREPHIYGTTTLTEIDERLHRLADERGVALETLHRITKAFWSTSCRRSSTRSTARCSIRRRWTQHGAALHDASKAMPFPVLEVHMTNIATREPWRDHSIISSVVKASTQGLGWRSYTAGLDGPHRPGSRTEARCQSAAHAAGEAQGRRQPPTLRWPSKKRA